jgi:hypothetical protein
MKSCDSISKHQRIESTLISKLNEEEHCLLVKVPSEASQMCCCQKALCPEAVQALELKLSAFLLPSLSFETNDLT